MSQQQHPFNDLLSRTTRVSQYQKGKTNLEQETVSGSESADRMQICISSQTDKHASIPPF